MSQLLLSRGIAYLSWGIALLSPGIAHLSPGIAHLSPSIAHCPGALPPVPGHFPLSRGIAHLSCLPSPLPIFMSLHPSAHHHLPFASKTLGHKPMGPFLPNS